MSAGQKQSRASRYAQLVGLAESRRALNVTQAELAKLAGCHPWTISLLERGQRGCQRSVRDAIHQSIQILQMRKGIAS